MMVEGSICRSCFHSHVCERFNENKDDNNKKCHFSNNHFVPTDEVVEMITKKQQLDQANNGNIKLRKMLAAEREKVKGYEQLAKVHSAYIDIFLKKLEATKGNAITIDAAEVKKALEHYETRATVNADGSYSLYCEIIE